MGFTNSPFFSNRFNNSEYYITFNALHIIFIAILEHLQNLYGQKIINSLIDISFFSVLLTIFHNFSYYPIICFCSFVYEIIETLSWSYISSGITFQVLSALEFIYALNVMPENVMRIFYWSIIIFGFTNVEIIRFNFRFTLYEFYLFVMLLIILFFPFAIDKYSNLYPFRINGLMSKKVFDKIVLSFTSKKESNFESPIHKNLILIEIESFETKCLGRFNKLYPKSMPFLSNLSDNILHFSKIPSQPYTTWSAAGMFVVHCGFPLIVNNVDWSVRGSENFELWKKLPCISDYLDQLGYNQKAFCTGSCDIMNMKGFIIDHHYQTFDMAEHGIDRDSVLFNHIENDILPDLVKTSKEEKKPFSLFILTADTHPEFWVDDKFCSDLTDENFKPENENNDNSNGQNNVHTVNDENGVAGLEKKKGDDDSLEKKNEVDDDRSEKKKKKEEGDSSEKKKKKGDDKVDDDRSEKKKKKGGDDDSSEKKKKKGDNEVDDDHSEKKKKEGGDDDSSEKKKKEGDDDGRSEKKKKSGDDDSSEKKKNKKGGDDDGSSEKKKKNRDDDESSDKKLILLDEENIDKKNKSESDVTDKKKKIKDEVESSKKKKNKDDESDKKKNKDEDESDKKKKDSEDESSKKKKNDEGDESSKKKKNDEGDESSKKKKDDNEDESSKKKKNDEDESSKKKKDDNDEETTKKKDSEEEYNSSKKNDNDDASTKNENDPNHWSEKFEDNGDMRFNGDFDRSKEPMPKLFRCFTCFDRMFKKFYKKVQELGLNASNTVFAVYGDHLTMGERTYYYGEDRTLSLIFPLMTKKYLEQQFRTTKKSVESKKITYYDVAPTILDLLNVKYSPPFPFGNSAFSAEQNDPPSVDDFKFIYNYLTGDIKYENVRCLNSEGFCTGNEY